ncbi:cation-dependent mannose-6-phosphate receptor [Erpetoichthys calabaricus]|uniref:Cation-dependent mannose-6-phosphate receptor n=1 Tax=Erpetoichthys calabaricus TaxID=27687 RepID=A0A8C4S711_ERPCA|nr:cation-dependent mannose-6-phosphate receptor [Erpetoichthys calabaricus]XP_028665795.1 cation-dependent mannose-6-phosphate receptor [Erpetoichthys calabaricus]
MNVRCASVWPMLCLLFLSKDGQADISTKNCKLYGGDGTPSVIEQNLLAKLEPLTKFNFTTQENENEKFTYRFRVCGQAGNITNGGLVQLDEKQQETVVGRYNSTQVIGGSDWIMLIYNEGDKYDHHCDKESRKAIVMISCNRKTVQSDFTVIVEERNRPHDCFYLFELDSNAACPAEVHQLSAGSILLIVFSSCLILYIIGGFLYQRLVVGAKGMEQFPNYSFWQDLGNLTADGCDFICRSRTQNAPPTYRGVASEPLGGEEVEERDDHLLPM